MSRNRRTDFFRNLLDLKERTNLVLATLDDELVSVARVTEVSTFLKGLPRSSDHYSRQRGLEALWSQRGAAQAHAGRVEDGISEGGRDRADRALARPRRRQFGAFDQHDIDRLWRVGDLVMLRIGGRTNRCWSRWRGRRRPPRTRRGWCPGRRCVDAVPQPVRVDDQPAVMGDREFARPDLAAAAVDLDLSDDRDHRPRALGVGDAAPD